jgi:replicative DNA helicase
MSMETAILGMCMRGAKNFHTCLGLGLQPKHFGEYSDIFQNMMVADAAGSPLDLVNLAPLLPEALAAKLIDIDTAAPISVNLEYFTKELLNQHRLKQIKTAMGDAVVKIGRLSPFDDASEIVAGVLAVIDGPQQRAASRNFQVRDLLNDFIDDMESLISGEKKVVSTGLKPLDTLLGGFHNGDLIVLAARPGIGKTTLGLQFAMTVAAQGLNAVFVTMEMTANQLVHKMVSARGKVCSKKMRNGKLSSEDMDLIVAASQSLAKEPLFVTVDNKRDVGILAAEIRGLKRQNKIDFLVIDYAQLLKASGEWRGNRVQEMAEISGTLKTLALEAKIPIVLLSQINRDAAKSSGLPGLHHLRDSGSLEQDADAVLILHTEANGNDTEYSIIIAKNRHGNTAKYNLGADLSTNTFYFDSKY